LCSRVVRWANRAAITGLLGSAAQTARQAATWAAPRFPDSEIDAISCCELPVQILVVDLLRCPVAES
jgi:hypothetical protein